MSEQNIKERPEELIQAKHLIDEGKNDDTFQVMNNFEKTGKHSPHEIVLCHLLKCKLLL